MNIYNLHSAIVARVIWALALVGGFAVANASAATTYYVTATGNDGNSGTAASPFRTIQRAADIVNPGGRRHRRRRRLHRYRW